MTAIPHAIAALVITGAACTAGVVPLKAGRTAEPLVCELRLTEGRGRVTISAEAEARTPTHGTYQLEIDQRSSAGRSTIRQGGEFDLRAGERAILGETSLSGRARDVAASLTVTTDGKTRSCRSAPL